MIRIEIRDTAESVEGVLELPNSSFNLTKGVSTIDTLNGGRGGSYSKTFSVPANHENNQVLEHIYNSNAKDYANMYVKKPAILFYDDVQIERGKVLLQKTKHLRDGAEYEVTYFGNNLEWVLDLKDIKLNEVSFDNNTFTYTEANVESSWTNTYPTDQYVFPHIDYGKSSLNYIPLEDFRPAVFLKHIIEGSLNQNGWALSSTFMDDSGFKKLIVPFFGDNFRRSETFTTNRGFLVSIGVGQQTQAVDNSLTKFPFTDDSSGSNFNTATDAFDISVPNNDHTVESNGRYFYKLFVTHVKDSNVASTNIQYRAYKNGSLLQILDTVDYNDETTQALSTGFIDLEAGDVIDFRWQIIGGSVSGNTDTFTASCRCVMSPTITAGTDFDMSDVLSSEVSVMDIINDTTRMFNLIWRADNSTKTVYVEERDTFIDSLGNSIDYTGKLDYSKEAVISKPSTYKRDLDFHYADDPNDAIIAKIQKDERRKYRSYCHDFTDDFEEGSQALSTNLVAATYDWYHLLLNNNTFIPMITAKMNNDTNGGTWTTGYSPRILNYVYSTQTDNDGNTKTWYYNSSTNNKTTYPAAILDTVDLTEHTTYSVGSLTAPMNLGWDKTDGLVDSYYDKTLKTIETGIKCEASFHISFTEFKDFDFTKAIYLDAPEHLSGYWYVESIEDWSPDKESIKFKMLKLEAVEPIPIIEFSPLDPNQPLPDGGGMIPSGNFGGGGGDANQPSFILGNNSGNDALWGYGSTVMGFGNQSTGYQQTVMGKYNYVANTTDQFMLGYGSLKEPANAMIVDVSGDVYFHGDATNSYNTKISKTSGLVASVTVVDEPYNVATRDNVVSIDNTNAAAWGNSLTMTLPASPETGKEYTFIDHNGDFATYNAVIDGNGNNINGAATLTLVSDYEGVQIVYSGSEWRIK